MTQNIFTLHTRNVHTHSLSHTYTHECLKTLVNSAKFASWRVRKFPEIKLKKKKQTIVRTKERTLMNLSTHENEHDWFHVLECQLCGSQKQNKKNVSFAGVPFDSCQAFPGFLTTAHSVCVPAVVGALAVWRQNMKIKKNSQTFANF